MKSLYVIIASVVLSSLVSYYIVQPLRLGSTVISTVTTDTLDTFRTNVNSSLTSLQNDKVSTTTSYIWTALQSFSANASSTAFSSNFAEFGGTATTTISTTGTVGVASTSPLGKLGIGTANATSTVSGGYFCGYFQDEQKRGMWIKLSISGNTVFSTSTTPCNQ